MSTYPSTALYSNTAAIQGSSMSTSRLIAFQVRLTEGVRSSLRSGSDDPVREDGFEIAQSMGIALLGLVVAATFATLLEALGVEIIQGIRNEIGL